jgi:transposase
MQMKTRQKTKRRQQKLTQQDIPKLEALKQLNLNAAGLDIGDAEIYAAVPEDRDEISVRVFKTFTIDLYALADWLQACGVDTVAMESTGVYWIPIYDILEERGFEVYLVNAHQVKSVTGRKTDILDCQWLQQLHTYGLLQASFRPDEDIRALRSLVRHRETLLKSCSREIQHMQKALQQMNLKLTNVVSDITGVTGMRIIRDIVAGQHDPLILAGHRDYRCANSADDIAKSLHGDYKSQHLFALKQALQAYDFFQQQITDCDAQLQHHYATFDPKVDPDQKPLKPAPRQPGKNYPAFDLRLYLYQMTGVDLTQIEGVNTLTVQTLISEIGTDMSKFPSLKHFTSWLGLCPHNDKTGGKIIKVSTKKSQNRAAAALRMAAQSLTHSNGPLGSFHRRMRAKLGKPEAITASAHKLARIIYAMLKNQTEYIAPDPELYEAQARQRAVKSLKRKAHKLGFQVLPATS